LSDTVSSIARFSPWLVGNQLAAPFEFTNLRMVYSFQFPNHASLPYAVASAAILAVSFRPGPTIGYAWVYIVRRHPRHSFKGWAGAERRRGNVAARLSASTWG
jgi:hypothetical protein